MNSIVYCPIPWPNFDWEPFSNWCLGEGKNEKWYFQTKRTASFLPVFGWQPRKRSPDFFKYMMQWAEVCAYINDYILPLTEPLPDIHILHSPPGTELPIHVDCHDLDLIRQKPTYKLRIVIKGAPETLWFQDNQDKLRVPNQYTNYCINGSMIHGMDNVTEDKLVLAIGWPWKGRNDKFLQMLEHWATQSNNVLYSNDINNGSTTTEMLDTMGYKPCQ